MFLKFHKRKNTAVCLLILLILLQISVAFAYSVTMRTGLRTVAVDGSAFAQAIYNFINGNGLVTTTQQAPYIEQSWLGVHFSPILYAIAPIYYLFPYVETLLFIHSFFIALAAVPIFLIARKLLETDGQALIIAVFYLFTPFIINAQILDFHEIAFAPLTISLMLWAVINKSKYWLVFFCAILLTIKEHYGLAVFGTGLLWAWHWREPKFGLSLAAFGLVSFIVVIKILMPYFNPSGAAAMLDENSNMDHFSWLLHPFRDTDILLGRIIEAIFYVILLFFPLLFQPLFSLVWLLPALADVATNSLSDFVMMRQPFSYHSAAIIPVLLVAYAKTISTKYTNVSKIKYKEMLTITSLTMMFFSYSFVSLPYFPNNILEFSAPRFSLAPQNEAALGEIKKLIGDDSSISAQINILPHISTRRYMYIFPNKFAETDYIVINTALPFRNRPNFFKEDYFAAVAKVINDPNWGVIFHKDNWLLFKRGGERNEQLLNSATQEINEFNIEVQEHSKRLSKKTSPN